MRLKKDKSGDTVGRPSWRSSLPGDPGAEFFCEKPQHMNNSLNFANTCLKVVDTRRRATLLANAVKTRLKDHLPQSLVGRVEYHLKPERLDSWGGPFNGQCFRQL